jgi:hypothetical protein
MLDQDVQSRVDAYRGNPQALQQKYSVSKDLLDLMALQKLTKEKESAARELQMAMAAQQGQGAGTIRDQLQQKALGMTKQELQKQQIALLQQKQQQQQQNMQQLAQSGIAQNPAPNMEGGPGFASGGIIAFANGAEVPKVHGIAGAPSSDPYSEINVARDKVRRGEPLTERDEALLRNAEQMRIRKLGPDAQVNPLKPPVVGRQPDGTAPKISMQEAQDVVGNVGAASAPGYRGPNPLDQQRALERGVVIPQQAAPAAKYQGTPSDAIREAAERAGILAPFRQATVSGSAPPAPTRNMGGGGGGGGGQQAGLGALTPATVDTSGAPQAVDISQFSPESEADKAFRQTVRGAARSASQQDPAAIERARALAKTELSLTPDERAKMEANLAAREAMTREQMDPERLARSRLIQSLAGGAYGSTPGLGLAGFALAGENVASRQDAARRAQMIEDQGYGEKILGLDMAARKGGVEISDKEAQRQSEMARTGISALGSLGSAMENANATRTQAAASFQSARLTDWNNVKVNEAKMANDLKLHQLDKDSAREVANINARAHADLAAATREATTESKRQEAIARFMTAQTNAEKVLDSRYAVQIREAEKRKANLEVMKQPTAKVDAELDMLIAGRERDRQAIIRQTQDALTQVGGAGNTGKWGQVTKQPSK